VGREPPAGTRRQIEQSRLPAAGHHLAHGGKAPYHPANRQGLPAGAKGDVGSHGRPRRRNTATTATGHRSLSWLSGPSAADACGHSCVPAYPESVTARGIAGDFINEMYVAVMEERALWQLPGGTTDLLPDGSVKHGPWEPRACSELIIRWLDRGWVDLYLPDVPEQWNLKPAAWQARTDRWGAFSILDPDDARQLLQDWRRWTDWLRCYWRAGRQVQDEHG
jgi:hypothetical protein